MKRFVANCRKRPEDRNGREISNTEFENAEKILKRTVQRECFPKPRNVPIINVLKANEELLQVKTKITKHKDGPCFLTPILIPTNCGLTIRLVKCLHKSICHVGTQILLSIIKEKPAASAPVAVLEDRDRDVKVFDITGIDLAGPFFLLNSDWTY
ncbi:putative RNA-directed DNA polymerase from transposon X-element [Trichonephila inaurata madagascariensis]|uniref:Putative RNA-directed DNA polymerase from transposon X-element n=1 Tax=Trichonephila inaurata madagascariensis TaxID=2747483 RepID=A0A8X6MFY9_9ARAC|nr:putative RNA-directed DNA polymerase from transposon X-element [Trichonephila inaurata madagascariensis]